MQRFLASIEELRENTGHVRYEANGSLRFAVLYGVYPTRQAAREAGATLPTRLAVNEPWIRRIGELQERALP